MARSIVQTSLERVRHLVIIAVAGLTVTTAETFLWAIAKTVRLIGTLLDGGWRSDETIVDLLEVIDTYLLAIVQLIVAIGLYELFIAALDVPDWLKARSLDDLKKSIVDVLIVFIGVKGVERLVVTEDPVDTLAFAGAVALLIGALSLFRLKPGRTGPSSPPHECGEVSGPNTSTT